MHKKNPWRFAFLGMTILSGLWLIIDRLLPWLVVRLMSPNAASIGVIGGADGPTAIFITSRPGNILEQLVPLALLIIGIGGYLFLRRKPTDTNKKGEA